MEKFAEILLYAGRWWTGCWRWQCSAIMKISFRVSTSIPVRKNWPGKHDSGSLKQESRRIDRCDLVDTLAQGFHECRKIGDNAKIMWYVIVHLAFVDSTTGMTWVDKMNKHAAA